MFIRSDLDPNNLNIYNKFYKNIRTNKKEKKGDDIDKMTLTCRAFEARYEFSPFKSFRYIFCLEEKLI